MNAKYQTRPTNMALAFVNAAVKPLQTKGSKATWIARRVEVNADREVGQTTERGINAHLSHRTAENLQKSGVL